MLAGSPLSYWAGVRGKNPMRYLGGILGGSWMTAMVGDLGKGIFDGANLVANFESLHPANTLWKKPYDVYSKVDTEASRFLEFEKWWGSPVLLNAVEMQSIADELFIGNKLASGELRSADGTVVDLRNIRSPIVVFCSRGDDITPPQQALDWILDLYEHESEIVAAGQTIVYSLHQSIGHLGIFVSGKVATKEHGEFTQCMDLIDLMPPGLYEAVITGVDEGTENPQLVTGDYLFTLEGRSLDDIRALGGNTPEEDRCFAAAARVSEINHGLYRACLAPFVEHIASPQSADLLRRLHPNRLRFEMFADSNPVDGAGPRRGRGRPQRAPAGEPPTIRGSSRRMRSRTRSSPASKAGRRCAIRCRRPSSSISMAHPCCRRWWAWAPTAARSPGASAGTSPATSPPAGWRWSWNGASTRVA